MPVRAVMPGISIVNLSRALVPLSTELVDGRLSSQADTRATTRAGSVQGEAREMFSAGNATSSHAGLASPPPLLNLLDNTKTKEER